MEPAYAESVTKRAKAFLADIEKNLSDFEKKRSSFNRTARSKARTLFNEYRKRLESKRQPGSISANLFPVSPENIIREILGVNYIEPESIPTQDYEDFTIGKSLTEIAGLIDRDNHRIVIANKFPVEWRRFTAAHEIGHWLMHKDVVYLRERRIGPSHGIRESSDAIRYRERPITGHELSHSKRSPQEREADTFAAELLMPREHVIEQFFLRFGGPIGRQRNSADFSFWLSLGVKSNIDMRSFWKMRSRDRAVVFARISSFNGRHFDSMAKCFGVSITPMAIQLEDLGLVG